jgi:hypothetical protein
MQSYLPNENELLPKNRTYKMIIGELGEEFVCRNIQCIECGAKDFINLNEIQTNVPGVDIQCRQCLQYVQVKTFEQKSNGSNHIIQMNKDDFLWDDVKIPVLNRKLRNTLVQYHNNIRYYCVIYSYTPLKKRQVNYIAISEPLSITNLCIGPRGGKFIRSKNTKWVYP